jgi:hypothetical protein
MSRAPLRIVCIAVALAGCTRREPPQWDAGGGSLAVVALPPGMAVQSDAAGADASDAGAAAIADAGDLSGEDAGTLPQTHDEPEPSGARFDGRVAALWDAIVNDDPDRAMPFFFPLTAYEQVKAISNPARDWRLRLVAAYKRDIRDLHLRLGPHASHAKLVRVEVPMPRARWVDPGEEYNRIGYWRVFGTKLRGDVDGRTVTIDVTSLISWRGEWYCVHLSGVK